MLTLWPAWIPSEALGAIPYGKECCLSCTHNSRDSLETVMKKQGDSGEGKKAQLHHGQLLLQNTGIHEWGWW